MIDFTVTDEQEERRKALEDFCEKHVAPGATARDLERRFDRDLYKRLATEAGYLGATVPGSAGGQGLTAEDQSLLQATLAKADPALHLAADAVQSWAGTVLRETGGETAESALAGIAGGEQIVAFAVNEPLASGDRADVATVATGADDDWRLTGLKSWVLLAPEADAFVVYAQVGEEGDEHAFFHVSADEVRVDEALPYAAFRSLPIADIELEGARATILGGTGDGEALLARAEAAAQLSVAWGAQGIVERCLEIARDHAMDRKVDGKPIAKKQEVHFAIADIRAVGDAILRTAQKATWAFEHRRDDYRFLAMMVKLYAAREAPKAVGNAIHVLGAEGQREGSFTELVHRCVETYSVLAVPNEILLDRLATDSLETFR